MLRRGLALALLAAALSSAAQAGGRARLVQDEGDASRADQRAKRLKGRIDLALANIQFARCGGDMPCEPASAAERAQPPITQAEAKIVLRQGTLNGAAKRCGLDWQGQGFEPMMAHWRALGKSERQMALFTILHGMAQAEAEAVLGAEACTDVMLRNIQALLPFRS